MGKFFEHLDEKLDLLEILRKFSKFSENFLKKIAKMHDFSVFFKRFNELCGNFSRVWTKIQIVENFSKGFLEKLLKTHYFCMFSKKINKPCVCFSSRLDEKQFVGKF